MKVKIAEPGMIATDFAGRSFDFTNEASMVEYQELVQNPMASFAKSPHEPSPPSVVADVIWAAVTDGTDTLRYTA